MNDYIKKTFYKNIDNKGNKHFFLFVNNHYVEVDESVYKVCRNSYMKIQYDKKREATWSIHYYDDIDQVAFLYADKNSESALSTQIYVKELANQAIELINQLPDQEKRLLIIYSFKRNQSGKLLNYYI